MARKTIDPDEKKALDILDKIETQFHKINYQAGEPSGERDKFVKWIDQITEYIEYGYFP